MFVGFEMACLGHGHYLVVVLPVGGSKAIDIKLELQREPRNSKTWFRDGSILPNETLVDDVFRELFEETGLTLTADDLTLLTGNPVRVPLPVGQHHMVHVFSA
jgi:8-oxo-dGTP pyrophosphatase MutT (NUDIX family)